MDPSNPVSPSQPPEDSNNLFHPDQEPATPVITPPVASVAPIPPPENYQDPGSEPEASQITWTASEFIAHEKSFNWYVGLSAVAVVVAALIRLITRDIFAAVVVFIGILLLGVYAAHKPQELTYALDNDGLSIGPRRYSFSDFRSFSTESEGTFPSVELVPIKRFAMYTTIYFDRNDADKIIGMLSTHLPLEEPRGDPIDQLMRRIRF